MNRQLLLHTLIASVSAILLAGTAGAQVAKGLLREGDALPAAGAGHIVNALSNTGVNGVGGYSATINSSDGGTTLSHVWGTATGVGPAIMRTEKLVGTLDQQSFESFFGMDDLGAIAYSPSCTDTGTLVTGIDCVFTDDTPKAVEDDPIASLPGKMFRFASRPGITHNGFTYWVSGIDDIGTGANEGNGLFNDLGVVFKTGDTIAGLPAPCDASAADFDVRYSPDASHWIIGTDTTATSTADYFVLVDGLPISTSAGLIGENEPVPADLGGLAGELFDNFDFYGITDAGDHLITGDTAAASTEDEFVAYNGTIIYREGDILDGLELSGSIEGAFMNNSGDIAFIWDVNDPVDGNVEALYLNSKLLLKEGDAVDLDGDGVVEPASILTSFTGISAVTMGEDRKIYFTADIDVNGTSSTSDDIEAFMVIEDACGSSRRFGAGCPGGGGFVPKIHVTGCSTPGGAISLELEKGLGGAVTLIVAGSAEANLALGGGCNLYAFPLLQVGSATLAGAGDGMGTLSMPAVVPAATPPGSFFLQAFVMDPAGAKGYSASNGVRLDVP